MISERQQTAILARTFFSRMFESDLMPPGLPQVQLLISLFAFFAAPSLILPLVLAKQYMFPPSVEIMRSMLARDRTMAILLAMTATAFITLAIWENIFPDRRDSQTLGVLPVRHRSFVVARLWAIVLLFVLLFPLTAAISSFGFGVIGAMTGGGFFGAAAAHFVSVSGAEAFIFFGILAIQCALLTVTGPTAAHRLSVVLQIVLIVAVLQLPMVMPAGPSFALSEDGAPGWVQTISASLMVPLWFLSLYQALAGHAYAGTERLIWIAAGLGTLTPVLALGFYAASYRRLTRLAIEGRPIPRRRRSPVAGRLISAASRAFTRVPSAAAVCAFTIRTLVRSRQHRMLIAVWAGVALALTISAALPMIVRFGWVVLDEPRDALLAGPLIFATLIQTGMRSLFAIPVEIKANWSFRLREPLRLQDALAGAAAALILCGVIPPMLLALVSAGAIWGFAIGLQHAIFCGVLATALVQILMRGVDRMPFTCTYTPGTAHIGTLWPFYLTLFSIFTYGMANLEEEVIGHGQAFPTTIIIFGAITLLLWWSRVREARQLVNLRFEAEPENGLTLVPF